MKTPCDKFTMVNGLFVAMSKFISILLRYCTRIWLDGPSEGLNDDFFSDLFIVPSFACPISYHK